MKNWKFWSENMKIRKKLKTLLPLVACHKYRNSRKLVEISIFFPYGCHTLNNYKMIDRV